MTFRSLLGRSPRVGMRPIPFLGTFLFVGLLFAIQQWLGARIWYEKMQVSLLPIIAAWELQYFLWGVICWGLWRWLGNALQKAGWRYILIRIVPFSIVTSIAVEMVLSIWFPISLSKHNSMTYWQRLDFGLAEEFLENTAIFWGAFVVIRAIGYYRASRQAERDMAQLAIELTEARMQVLRMQINPHFLFNTMNNISSLMYSDVQAADKTLEQLSSLLRVSLKHGSQQLICLHEELEFAEMYLSLQDIRSAGQVVQRIHVQPQLYDALVPTMILQPIVENAYIHGLAKVVKGFIEIDAREEHGQLSISVRNTGVGLDSDRVSGANGLGIGLTNIKSRLRLHFGEQSDLSIREIAGNVVEVTVRFPLTFAASDNPAFEAEQLLPRQTTADPVRT